MLSFFTAIYLSVSLLLDFLRAESNLIENRMIEIRENDSDFGRESSSLQGKEKRELNLSFIHVSKRLEEELDISGLNIKGEEFIFLWILIAVVPAFLFFGISGSFLKTFFVVVLMAIAPPVYVKILIARKRLAFEEQLGDSLQLLSNGIRSGFSFQQALGNLSEDMPDPLGSEFRAANREILLGVDIETAFTKIARRMNSDDMDILTAAIVIQRQVGGNLAYILDNISGTIRERLKIRALIRTLTAQGRISGLIIGVIPVGLLVIITLMNPEYTAVLFETTYGHLMLGVAAFLEIIGFLVIRKIIDIEY